eukprot:gene5354-biopygen4104
MCHVGSAVRRLAAPCAVWAAPCGAVRTPCRVGTAVRRHVVQCGAVCAVCAVWQSGAPCGMPCGLFPRCTFIQRK